MAYKTRIDLPDGTSISSGPGRGNKIITSTITETANGDGADLAPGAVCTAVFECKIQIPDGELPLNKNDEIGVWYAQDKTAYGMGTYIVAEILKTGAKFCKITAYDRASKFDKNLTDWVAALDGWPYTVSEFAGMVCAECGVTLASRKWINGTYAIQKFIGSGITGRTLMGWIAQIEAGTAYADSSGTIRIFSYDKISTKISASGDLRYYGNSLKYEDFSCEKIQQVRIQLTEDDTGVVYPVGLENPNILDITGNYLLTATETNQLETVAKNIYDKWKNLAYTPCRVKLPFSTQIKRGDRVDITDANGRTITTCVMTRTVSGQSMTLESTGNTSRGSATAIHDISMGAINAKMLEVKRDISGLNLRATSIETKIDDVQSSVSSDIAQVKKQVAEIDIRADGIQSSVSSEIEGMKTELSEVRQDATSWSARVEAIEQDGVDKITTGTGITLDKEGLHVDEDGKPTSTLIDASGMDVTRRADGQKLLEVRDSGVKTENLNVRNYVIFGYTRFEKYSDSNDSVQTAMFFYPEGAG